MKILLVVVALSGCGNGVFLEPKLKSPLQAGPLDCSAVCVAVATQLIRDFDVTPDCTAPEFPVATDCAACREVFASKYGVQLVGCQ